MRREHRILLGALVGFLALALGVRFLGGESSPSKLAATLVKPASVSADSVASTLPLVAAVAETTTTVAAPVSNGCAASGHSAVVDRVNQRSWLCNDGQITETFVMTSANSQPDPGTYKVYAKDLKASSTLTGKFSTMTHFVAFTRGKYTNARIAFHSIPKYSNGEYVQPLESVGTVEKHGASAGCIRVLPEDSVKIWDWLDKGDPVIVVS
ncbi:MAG: L,D-transpeptidase [Actinomycetota bacterium]